MWSFLVCRETSALKTVGPSQVVIFYGCQGSNQSLPNLSSIAVLANAVLATWAGWDFESDWNDWIKEEEDEDWQEGCGCGSGGFFDR